LGRFYGKLRLITSVEAPATAAEAENWRRRVGRAQALRSAVALGAAAARGEAAATVAGSLSDGGADMLREARRVLWLNPSSGGRIRRGVAAGGPVKRAA